MSRTAAGEWPTLLQRKAAQEQAEAQFALLVERQSRFAFRIAYAVLRNVDDAEDIVQDTFFKLFRSGAWKRMGDEKAFLARMVWRLAVTRKPSRHFVPAVESGGVASNQSSPEKAAIATERSRTIHRLIDGLPERLRRPLSLSSIEGMTAREIAAVIDSPEGTVRRLLSEARALIKEKISRMEGSKDE
ncbi:MAG: RNA polymerase sigma factor [Terriglobia bacterium]